MPERAVTRLAAGSASRVRSVSTPDLSGTDPDLSETRRGQRHKHRVVGLPVAGLIVLGMCGLAMAGLATSRVGIVAAVVGALAASLLVGVVVTVIVWIDRWEPEPPLLMLGAFLWGAGGATACALMLNDTVTGLGERMLAPGAEVFVTRVVMAPLVEEAAKALFVVALWFRRRSEFNGLVEGIVYAAMTAAGFAFIENIFYFGRAFAEDGVGNLSGGVIAVFVLRGVLAPFSHPLFSSMVGIGIGLAAGARRRRPRALWPAIGFVVAVTLHGVWNASTLLGGADFLQIYFLIMVPIFAGTGWMVAWQRGREQRIVVNQLPALQRAGLINRAEMDLLATFAGRRGWQRKVRRGAGREAARAVRDYQLTVTELAFLRYRMRKGYSISAAHRARGTRLIEKLSATKGSVAGTALSAVGELTTRRSPLRRRSG
jgi:RsiW-degrading membrane proteinase PrsW (M82 family)